jgi:predicted metal-dependent enzyme (double-stranded beta helix superfamily)
VSVSLTLPRPTLPARLLKTADPRTPPALDAVVAAVAAHRGVWQHHIRFDAAARWSMRLHADDDLDLWLISWTPDQSTTLHDHGDSAGALAVVEGRLTELTAGRHDLHRLRRRELTPGPVRTFGPRHVHDVINASDVPAVSVHAYSPPLRSMTYYATGAYGLSKIGTVQTEEPEPAAPVRPTVAGSLA